MTHDDRGRTIQILLVEDNPGDVRLTQEALKEGHVAHALSAVPNGEQALAYLRKQGPYAQSPDPDLILLDLNLPRMSGREVLAEIKRDPALRKIPVVVLTTSNSDDDIEAAYDLHCSCYITKPVDLQQFVRVMETIDSFWLHVVTFPPRR